MFDPASVRFTGPLRPYVEGFWLELQRQGYAPLSAGNLLRVAAHYSRWLKHKSLAVSDISEETIAAFMKRRRRQGYSQFLTPRALAFLLRHLRDRSLVQAVALPAATSPIDLLVLEYVAYLSRSRGLCASTIRGYAEFAKRFASVMFRGGALRWEQLTPADITQFVLGRARKWCPGTCQSETTALRSLLRYLHARGRIERDLANCVPAVARWRLSGLPKGLEPDQVRLLLRTLRSRSVVGRRAAAIVLLMLRLGLRAGDLAALTLDDLDWRSGEIILHGKGRRENHLPLPRDVGRTLATYLQRGRPRSTSRYVFLSTRAPYAPLAGGGVVAAAMAVLKRAGIAGGSHLLRHTAATQMLRAGASLPEIGHVLRHRHLDTTAIYAKVDFAALRTVVQPWPVGAP